MIYMFIFFFKHKTAYEMRISDWSSDVCSSDLFRSGQGALLDALLIKNVATLSTAGVIDLDEVVQDGVRVRASAGSGSYRRKKKLRKELKKARRLVALLKQERDDDPEAS